MKHVLVLNYEFPPLGGGASPVSYEIAKGYAAAGYSVDVVTMAFGDLAKFENRDGLTIYRVASGRRKKSISTFWEQLAYLFSAFFIVRRLISRKQYSFSHCHFLVPTGILALVIYRLYGLKYIVTSHGSDVPGHNIDRFKILHKFTGPIIRQVINSAYRVTVPSQYLKDLIVNRVARRGRADNIVIIPNGCLTLERPNIVKENLILSVGRMQPMKGFQFLISAFKDLGNVGWKLILVGEGPSKKSLERQAGNASNIEFTGWLEASGDRLAELFNKAKIFALLSQRESQGLVYIEAMSAGCAILGSDWGAIKETVTPDIGILVNPTNGAEVSKGLARLISEPDLIERCSKQSKHRYQEFYSWHKIIDKYIALAQDI